jgi:hypothetical protein
MLRLVSRRLELPELSSNAERARVEGKQSLTFSPGSLFKRWALSLSPWKQKSARRSGASVACCVLLRAKRGQFQSCPFTSARRPHPIATTVTTVLARMRLQNTEKKINRPSRSGTTDKPFDARYSVGRAPNPLICPFRLV